MCGSCLKTHSHVSPGTDGQGPRIIEIRKGRWIRVQHIVPKTWRLHVSDTPDNEGVFMVNAAKTSSHGSQNSNRNSSTTYHSSGWVHEAPSSSSCSSVKTAVSKTSTVRTRLSNSAHKSHETPSSSCSSVKMAVSKMSTARTRLSNSAHRSHASLRSAYDDGNVMMFFIHGVGGSSDVWRHQIDYFVKEGFEVVAPDLLGHGFSRAPRQSSAYAFTELAEDMLTLFDGYSKRRNIVVGHSYG